MAMHYNERWFSEVSLDAFKYLTDRYGFTPIELPQPCNEGEMPFYTILFKNKHGQFVLVTLAPTKHELELSFGVDADLSGQPQEVYIHEYLKLFDPDGKHRVGWGPSTPDLLKDEVIRVAKTLERFANPFLERHETFWRDVDKRRRRAWGKRSTIIRPQPKTRTGVKKAQA
jgi:hypothetical protein